MEWMLIACDIRGGGWKWHRSCPRWTPFPSSALEFHASVMDLMIQRWHWWHLHSHYWANPFCICSKSNGHSTEWILTGLVPIRISVLITSWIVSILSLRHRIVQEMMEDQVMILICMVMKGMRNGYEAVLLHPFPKWVCATHQPLCRSTHVLYWWGFRRRFERTRLTGYEIPLFTLLS